MSQISGPRRRRRGEVEWQGRWGVPGILAGGDCHVWATVGDLLYRRDSLPACQLPLSCLADVEK
eukprot:2958361-Pyramimonas_sp.AAC.1